MIKEPVDGLLKIKDMGARYNKWLYSVCFKVKRTKVWNVLYL